MQDAGGELLLMGILGSSLPEEIAAWYTKIVHMGDAPALGSRHASPVVYRGGRDESRLYERRVCSL